MATAAVKSAAQMNNKKEIVFEKEQTKLNKIKKQKEK